MKLLNKFTIELDEFEKCKMIVDVDCPIGKIYDYACAVKSFIAAKIAEVDAQESKPAEQQPAPEAPSEV